jgi:hypothetical protein
MPKLVGKTFSNQHLEMRVYEKINKDNGVGVVNFASSNIWWWQNFGRDWQ